MLFPLLRVPAVVSFARPVFFAVAVMLLPTLAVAQPGTVTGTVTNSATSAPVPNAGVSFCSASSGGTSCFSTTANSSGVYSRNLDPGTYYAFTSNTGLLNEIFDNVPCAASACQGQTAVTTGTPIVVTSGATTAGTNFALDPGGSITGVVTDAASSAPVANVLVQIYTRSPLGGQLFVNSNTTDASGVYTVGGLGTATYYALTSNSVGYTNEIYDNILCVSSCSSTLAVQSGTGIDVVVGATTTGKNFALDVGGIITGTVLNSATSAPAQNVGVSVYTRVGDSINLVASGSTNASGVYTVRGLPTATYYVATSAFNANLINEIYNNLPCPGFCSLTLPNPGSPVQVSLGTTVAGIDFQLDPGGSVSGTIIDAATSLPLSGVSVNIYQQAGTGVTNVAFGSTNTLGVYSAGGLPSGTYFAVASTNTHIDEVYNNIACAGNCPNAAILGGTPIAVVAGAVSAGRDFALDAGGNIAGVVTSAATAAPLANVSITVVTSTNVFAGSTSSNSTGAWSIGGLAPGSYFAFTNASFIPRVTNEIYNDIPCATSCSSSTASSSGTPIVVTAGATTSGINFALGLSTSAPSAPTNFGALVSAFAAKFTWSVPSFGAFPTSYVIEAGLSSGTTLLTFPSTVNLFEIPGVPPGRFFLRVRAVNAFGTSPPSNEYVMVVNADGSGVLGAPLSFAARMNGARLTTTWADPTFGGVPTSYTLEVGTATGLSNIATVPSATRSFTFEPVPNGVYFMRVRSRVGTQVSPPSAEVMVVVGDVPSPPTAPRSLVHSLTGSTLTLTWLAPAVGTPTGYIIEAGTASGLSNIATLPTNSTALEAVFNGVPSGTYYVRVRAVSALGTSVVSNERTITIQ